MSRKTWVVLVVSTCLFSETALAADSPIGGLSVAKRHRIELGVGYWDSGEPRAISTECSYRLTTNVEDLLLTLSYAYWVEEKLSTNIDLSTLIVEARSTHGPSNACETAVVLSSAMFGFRYYPLATAQSALRPYVSASAGPIVGVESTWDPVEKRSWTRGTFGGRLGGGIDIEMGRYVMADVRVGYNVMADFPESLAGDVNYGGVDAGIGLSVLIGRGI